MFFEEDFVEKVRRSSEISELIGQFTVLKNTGRNLMGICPFPDHKEKSPSFSVSENKQLYHCFGCGKSGNIFTFLKDYQGLTFPEAIEYLAKRAGIPLPEKSEAHTKKHAKDFDLKKLNSYCRDQFVSQLKSLPKDHPALKYLATRKFSPELLEIFHIGYAPDKWDFISSSLKARNIPFKDIAEFGLFKSKDGQSYYDVFRNRIMFPIISITGDVLGFGGRVLDDSKPKYLNSPETSVFKKSQTFYGLHETGKEIRTEDYAIVVEGYTDLMALYQFGFKNVVATLGTALTEDHARIMKRYTKNVITLFDGDQAGINASEKAMRHLLSEGLLVKGIYLPSEEDPDSYLNKFGADKLRTEIRSAKDLYILYLDRMMKMQSIDQISDKMKILEKLVPVLNLIPFLPLKTLYAEETAFRLGMDKNWLLKYLHDNLNQKKADSKANERPHQSHTVQSQIGFKQQLSSNVVISQNNSNEPKNVVQDQQNNKIRLKNDNRNERDFINLLLMDEKCLKLAIENKVEDLLTGTGIGALYLKIVQLYRQQPSDFDTLTTVLMTFVEPISFLIEHLNKPLSESTEAQRMKMFQDYLLKLKQSQRRKKIKQFTSNIGPNSSIQDLEQIVNMKKRQLSEKES